MAYTPPSHLLLQLLPFLLPLFSTTSVATNYTVGGDAGWVFSASTNASATDYTAWAAASLTFHLGDFLIFNKGANSTVIQTYNATTYRLCSLEQDYGNLTSQFGVDDVEEDGGAGGIPVSLVREGDNYFFSSAEEGFQCRRGMRFQIKVRHGNVLPPPSALPPTVFTPEGGHVAFDAGRGGVVGGWKWWWGITSCVVLVWSV